MSRDTILTDDAAVCYSFDNIKTQGWLEGHYSGLHVAVNFLKERAVALFKEGQDGDATKMRRLAEEMNAKLEPEMRRRAEEHERDHPVVIEPE